MRLMACSGAPVDEPEAPGVPRAGWSAAPPSPRQPLCGDDWLHVVLGPTGTSGEFSGLARLCTTAGADVSCEIRLPPGSVDSQHRPDLVEGFAQLLDAVGSQTGLMFTGIDDLAELFNARLDVEEALELVTEWALQHGLSLGVLLLGRGCAAAVKPDGRVIRLDVEPASRLSWAGRDLAAMALIDAYCADPSDLEGCLGAVLDPALATRPAVRGL